MKNVVQVNRFLNAVLWILKSHEIRVNFDDFFVLLFVASNKFDVKRGVTGQ